MRKTTVAIALCGGLLMQSPVLAQTQDGLGGLITDVARGLLAQELERTAYEEARRVNTVRGWRDYLARFPNSIHRAQAEQALAQLGAPQPLPQPLPQPQPQPLPQPVPPVQAGPAATEAALGLGREQRRQIQLQLTALGYDAGIADGLWGRRTRDAITRWQTTNSLTATGYVTAPQLRRIADQAGATAPPVAPDPGVDDRTEESLLGLTRDERREVQRRLTALGYGTGGADGVFGQNSRRAIAAWQRNSGQRASGYITADQLRELRAQSANLVP